MGFCAPFLPFPDFTLCLLLLSLVGCQLLDAASAVHRISLKSFHAPSQPGTRNFAIPAKFYSEHLLIGNISVGTPENSYQVAFQLDMASSYLIGPEATIDDQFPKNVFDPDNSSTYKSQWADFTSESDDVFGQLGTDLAKIGDLSANFSLGVAQSVPFYVQRNPIDGEMGLAARFDGKNGVKSLLMELAQKMPVERWLLSVRIRPHEDVANIHQIPYDSSLTIGAEDAENCAPIWHYVQRLYAEECWKVRLSFLAVDGRKAYLSNDLEPEVAELNRHLRINYGPKKWIMRIAFALGGQFDSQANLFAIHCGSSAKLNIGFGDQGEEWTWQMGAEDYMIRRNGKCFLAFYAIDVGDWGFGPAFYRGNCVTFDFGRELIGFATSLEGR